MTAAESYALGRSDAETQRLMLQHQIYGPFTREFFRLAGITTGMHVLDLGSGAGDVALLVAELVGPAGRVTGVDQNGQILETAKARVAAAGWTNIEFRSGDLSALPRTDFDAVVGRWVLMYVDDPAQTVREAVARLRPGGVVAFQEGVFNEVRAPFLSGPLHEQVLRWMTPPPGAPGPDVQMGFKLQETFLAAGLRPPGFRLDTPMGGGPDWPGYAYLAATLRSLLPFLVQFGIVTADQVDIDTLTDRLRGEVIERNGVQFLPPLVGAWSYRV